MDDQRVRGIVVGPPAAIPGAAKDSQVVLGGDFTSVGGSNNPGYGLYRANATTGAKLPLPVNTVFRDGGNNAGVYSLASDSTSFYGTGWHFGGPGGNAEGTFQASWSSGSLVTLEDCHGDTYDVAPIGNVVYTAGHKHYCLNSGGFPQTVPTWTIWHGTAWTKAAQGTNAKDTFGYEDHPGTPRPAHPAVLPQVPDRHGHGSGPGDLDRHRQLAVRPCSPVSSPTSTGSPNRASCASACVRWRPTPAVHAPRTPAVHSPCERAPTRPARSSSPCRPPGTATTSA